jgi:hypothetical protein
MLACSQLWRLSLLLFTFDTRKFWLVKHSWPHVIVSDFRCLYTRCHKNSIKSTTAADKSASLESLAQRIRRALTAQHGVAAHHVVLIKEKTVPKTTSGKISRYRVRTAFLENSLSVLFRLDVQARRGGDDGGFDDEDALAELEGEGDDNNNNMAPTTANDSAGSRGKEGLTDVA